MFKKITFMLLITLLIGMFTSSVFAAPNTLDILGTWTGMAGEIFVKMLIVPFEDKTGIKVEYTGTTDITAVLPTRVKAGNPPDVSFLPKPGKMIEFAKEGKLVDLSTFMDIDVLRSDYSPTWIDLGSYKDKLYSVPLAADLKSLVWYSPKAFATAGYTVPTTWDEMIALSDKMVADGKTPWAIGLESGAGSGYLGTDWIEDIMLRTVEPEVYDLWVAHGISWLDGRVQRAFELFGQIVLNEKYIYGGRKAVLAINVMDSPDALFTTPPNAYMHKQASFARFFILSHFPNLVLGEDFDFFPFPPIDPQYGTPALGAGDVVIMFNDTPEARAFMQYVVSPEAQEIWAAVGKLSPNKRVSPAVYDDLTRKAAEMLVNAPTFRFDGSDLMPAAVGSDAFFWGVLDYVSGVPLKKVLMTIETSALDAYRK